jgi:hypothetical protein
MKDNKILLKHSIFANVFFSSFNLKGKFFIFFLHTSFSAVSVSIFITLSILVTHFNVRTQKHSNLFLFVPTSRSGNFHTLFILSGTKSQLAPVWLCQKRMSFSMFKIHFSAPYCFTFNHSRS